MTESTIAVNAFTGSTRHTFNTSETADTLDETNGHKVLGGYKHLILAFHLSAATANDVIRIAAGEYGPAFRSGIGYLDYTCAGGAEEACIHIDSSRFCQDDGYVHISFPTKVSIAGTIEAFGID